jgi:murein DD-endopeptidase MepM/ murein hydrolase activator NlpD
VKIRLFKSKPKFHFNPETLTYERIDNSWKHRLRQLGTHSMTGVLLGGVFFVIYLIAIEPPSVKQMRQENNRILAQYDLLGRQLKYQQNILSDLQERDDNLYRVVFQADPIPFSIRRAGYGGTNRYDALKEMTNSQIVVSTTQKMDELGRQMYIQSKSFDEIISLAKNKEKMLVCIPGIQPVFNKNLKCMVSGYGMRIDPVYHTPKFHEGMDFTAPTGTKIYATGDGTVVYASWKQGYGNCVMINHGFNYQTLYGHMSAIKTRLGQRLKRGDLIGLIGSTGKSTGPHLHYEVHFKGSPVNPQNFYFMDLSPADYDKMLQMTVNSAQVFD